MTVVDGTDEYIVIGGGVAGCVTGYLLTLHGHDVTIVERDEVGGLLRHIEFSDGTYCDSAPHILFYDPNTEQEVADLFQRFTTLREETFYAKTYPTGDLDEPHDYPVSEANIDRWDDAENIQCERERDRIPDDANTFEEYVRPRVGDTLYERYFGPYTEKHWGVDPGRVTGDWFDFKMNFPKTEQSFFQGSAAAYPSQKYEDILHEMVTDCTIEHATVTGLVTSNGSVDGIRTASGDRLVAEKFVNTIDPSIVANVKEDLEYRSMVIVGVRLAAPSRLFPEHVDWGYFPSDYNFTRVTDYGFTEQGLAPDEHVLTFEFPCFRDEDVYSWTPSQYETYIRKFLAGQGVESTIHELKIRRAPRAYPLPVREEINRFESMSEELSGLDDLYNLGRVATYQYIWIKDIVQQAIETVEAATGEAVTV